MRTKRLSVKGAKYSYSLQSEGRELFSCKFRNSVKEIALMYNGQSYALLRGEHDVHFSLRQGSRYGDDVWSIRFPGVDRDSGLRKAACYFLKDMDPAIPPSSTALTVPADMERLIQRLRESVGLPPLKQSLRNLVLVTPEDPEDIVAVFWKLLDGGYEVCVRAEISHLVAFAFGLSAWMSPRKPK
jgi:hypothetical protein